MKSLRLILTSFDSDGKILRKGIESLGYKRCGSYCAPGHLRFDCSTDTIFDIIKYWVSYFSFLFFSFFVIFF